MNVEEHMNDDTRTSSLTPSYRALLFVAVLSIFGSGTAVASVTIQCLSDFCPPEPPEVVADVCPFSVCSKTFEFRVSVEGAPMDSVVLSFTLEPETQPSFERILCAPPDPIEPHDTPCPDPPVVLPPPDVDPTSIALREGTWIVEARVARRTIVETSPPIRIRVLPSGFVLPGPVRLSAVDPNSGEPLVMLRDPGPNYPPSPQDPGGIHTAASEVRIVGMNLDNNPLLEVFAAPIPVGEPTLAPESALPVNDWYLFPAEITGRDPTSGGESFLQVKIPVLPLETTTTCGASPSFFGSIFAKNWRWVIRDPFAQEHRDWAIPSPRDPDPVHDAPPFRMVKPAYPRIDGFGFRNHATDPSYNEFLTVFGTNAYLCVGAFGECATHVPDPLYHLLWWPVYYLAVGATGGSCNGMSSTSLLMAREEVQPEDFEADVHFPAGFDSPGPGSIPKTDDDGNSYLEGVARYADTNFCTPVCSPPKPDNLWANIRMNHGVQISREFLLELIETLGEAIFNPNDLTSIKGVPNATLERIEGSPLNHVLCFFDLGVSVSTEELVDVRSGGHCVTPYKVDGTRIYIYDNKAPGDVARFIEIVGGEYYDYPERRLTDQKQPNQGNAIMAFPIDIWKNGRHLLGLDALVSLIGGDPVEFLYMIAVGSGDMIVTNDAGGRWGWEDDGTFTDSMFGAASIAPLGPPEEGSRTLPLLIAMNQPAPTIRMNADGGRYIFHTGASGHLLQLEASAMPGDKDQLQLGYAGGALRSFDFTPQRDTSLVVPRVGLAIGDEESAVFHWLGLKVPSGKSVGFDADKQSVAAIYRNDTGGPTHHVLALDHGSGPVESFGRMIYGPFDVPAGASHRVVPSSWPEVTEVVSELDFDRDGTPDHSEVITGRAVRTPLAQNASADLSVVKTVVPTSLSLGSNVTYTLTVANAGPDGATDVTLVDALPAHVAISSLTVTTGTCVKSSGLDCNFGDLATGETAVVTYVATPSLRGTLANGATVMGNEGDPDLTNNTAMAALDVPVLVDIKPGGFPNSINLKKEGVVPVAILGDGGFDATTVEPRAVCFGDVDSPSDRDCTHVQSGTRIEDVDRDGDMDLMLHYEVAQTGIDPADAQACLTGTTNTGRGFAGCDSIRIVP